MPIDRAAEYDNLVCTIRALLTAGDDGYDAYEAARLLLQRLGEYPEGLCPACGANPLTPGSPVLFRDDLTADDAWADWTKLYHCIDCEQSFD